MPLLISDFLASDAARLERETAVTIGVFDGVHLGHRRLIEETVARARGRGALALAVVFDPRPREVLRPESPPERLLPLDERISLIGEIGCDIVGLLRFDRQVAATPANAFAEVLVARYGMVELCVGPDFALGRGREGTVAVLTEIGQRLGFAVRTVRPFTVGGQTVSSTAIRALLAEGEVGRAAGLLGRPFAIRGEVVHGFGRGRTIGLPTANVALDPKLAVPADGVYVVWCRIESRDAEPGSLAGALLPGVASIGVRPTFDGGARSLEVHLLDFAGDIYGVRLRVEFVQRLRPEERFPSVEALLEQVRRDVAASRAILAI